MSGKTVVSENPFRRRNAVNQRIKGAWMFLFGLAAWAMISTAARPANADDKANGKKAGCQGHRLFAGQTERKNADFRHGAKHSDRIRVFQKNAKAIRKASARAPSRPEKAGNRRADARQGPEGPRGVAGTKSANRISRRRRNHANQHRGSEPQRNVRFSSMPWSMPIIHGVRRCGTEKTR